MSNDDDDNPMKYLSSVLHLSQATDDISSNLGVLIDDIII